MTLTAQHTAEVTNVAAVSDRKNYAFDQKLLETREVGNFWGLLDQLGISLAVTREYEHFALLLGGGKGDPLQSPLPLPHPSGMAYDEISGDLIISSTRTPNLIFWCKRVKPEDYSREIVPQDISFLKGDLFLPYRSTLLPGTLYIHEIALMGGELYANITGHNFIAKLGKMGGWERVWWPSKLDTLGNDGFRQNFFQLNSIAAGSSPDNSFYTAFSDLTDGSKPWKQGYGPKGKGVIFSGKSRDVLHRGLTCPHSVRIKNSKMWVCNSGYGELGSISGHETDDAALTRFHSATTLPGFTRGLAFAGDYAFVGLSRVIAQYEAYAPGITPEKSECAIYAVDLRNGAVAGGLVWEHGYQVFDIQVIKGMTRPRMPFGNLGPNEINAELRYLG